MKKIFAWIGQKIFWLLHGRREHLIWTASLNTEIAKLREQGDRLERLAEALSSEVRWAKEALSSEVRWAKTTSREAKTLAENLRDEVNKRAPRWAKKI
jgi:predicted  nucleic acid-binding Zn-ribbon protein